MSHSWSLACFFIMDGITEYVLLFSNEWKTETKSTPYSNIYRLYHKDITKIEPGLVPLTKAQFSPPAIIRAGATAKHSTMLLDVRYHTQNT